VKVESVNESMTESGKGDGNESKLTEHKKEEHNIETQKDEQGHDDSMMKVTTDHNIEVAKEEEASQEQPTVEDEKKEDSAAQ
jgi:hypothetical protein